MAKSSRIQELWTYIAECLRLLYWVYFKPFTLERWLRDIHPRVSFTYNTFKTQFQFATDIRIRRYVTQIWWLTVIVPLIVMLLIGFIYAVILNEPFDWFKSGFFLLGWQIGVWSLWQIVIEKRVTGQLLLLWGLITLSILFLLVIMAIYAPAIIENISLDAAIHLGFGVSLSMVITDKLNTTKSIAFGIIFCLLLGVANEILVNPIGTGIICIFLLSVGGFSYITAGGDEIIIQIGQNYTLISLVFLCQSMILLIFSVIFEINMTQNIGGGITEGIIIGLIGGIAFNIAFGIMFNIAFGLGLSLAFFSEGSIGFSFAFGIMWVFGILRIHFWIVELLWISLLTRFTSSVKRAERLCYLPHWYDQIIYLPLPFVDVWIVDTYSTSPAIACQMIDYLTNYTNQQKVAAQAIIGIAIKRLNQTRTIGDIIASSDELRWIPSPPPREAGPALPKLLEISRDVRAATNATSLYRRRELLNEPIKSLQDLVIQLTFEKNTRSVVTYREVIQQWQSILEAAQRTLDEQVQKASEISQTYVVGPALDPQRASSRFKGREDLFREIETVALSDLPPILLLQGGRRTGKSSTLNYLPERLPSTFVPLVVDVQGISDASTLTRLADSLASQVIKMALRSLNLTLPAPDSYALREDPFPALRKWMDDVEQTVGNKRILLCLDEFERLEEVIQETGSRAPLNFLRHVMQHRRQWVLLFSTSHRLEDLAPYWSDYLINTRTLRISYLEEHEARELIIKPVEDFPDIYEPETVEAIIQLTRCQPFLVQLICQEIVERLNRAQRKRATPEDVSAVASIAIERASGYFLELWNNILNEEERVVLRGLVAGEQPSAEARRVVRRLVRKEVLEQKEGIYDFQVPLVEAFVRHKVLDE